MTTEVVFLNAGSVEDPRLTYAVIQARYRGQWVLCRHKERATWEIPGGHHERGETALEAGARELAEETGALDFEIEPVCEYSVTTCDETDYGLLCFAEVQELGPIPDMCEIDEIALFDTLPAAKDLTYPAIQPHLFWRVLEYLRER